MISLKKISIQRDGAVKKMPHLHEASSTNQTHIKKWLPGNHQFSQTYFVFIDHSDEIYPVAQFRSVDSG
jgi:hypothetical protein